MSRSLVAALVLAASLPGATAVSAGGFAPAVEQPVQIVEPAQRRSSWGILLPLLLLGGAAAILGGGGDEGSASETTTTTSR